MRIIPHPSRARVSRVASNTNTYLLPCGFQTIMDLALVTLPVETATVLATCAEAWVIADMVTCNACMGVTPTTRARPAAGGCSPSATWRSDRARRASRSREGGRTRTVYPYTTIITSSSSSSSRDRSIVRLSDCPIGRRSAGFYYTVYTYHRGCMDDDWTIGRSDNRS